MILIVVLWFQDMASMGV